MAYKRVPESVDVGVLWFYVAEKAGVPGGNHQPWTGDHYPADADTGDRTHQINPLIIIKLVTISQFILSVVCAPCVIVTMQNLCNTANDPGHMIKMAAMSIHGKNLQNSSSSEPNCQFHWNLVFQIFQILHNVGQMSQCRQKILNPQCQSGYCTFTWLYVTLNMCNIPFTVFISINFRQSNCRYLL